MEGNFTIMNEMKQKQESSFGLADDPNLRQESKLLFF